MRRHWVAGSGQGSPSWRMERRPPPRPLIGAAPPPPPAGCWGCWRTGGGGAGSVRILSAPRAAPELSGRSLKQGTEQVQDNARQNLWFDNLAAKLNMERLDQNHLHHLQEVPRLICMSRPAGFRPDPDWIRIQSGQWIQIQEGKNDPQKLKKNFNSCFEVLDGLFCELQASSVTWTYFMEA